MFEINVREVEYEIGPDELRIGTDGWLIRRKSYDYETDYEPVFMVARTERRYNRGYYNETRYYYPDSIGRGSSIIFDSYINHSNQGYLHKIYSSEENAQKAIERMKKEILELKEKYYKGIKYVTVRAKKGFRVCEAEATLVEVGTPDPFHECRRSGENIWYLKIDGKYRIKCDKRYGCDEDLMRAIFDTREEAEQHCERRNARVAELKKVNEKYSLNSYEGA